MGSALLGLFALVVLLAVNLAVLSAARSFVGGAFGIADLGPFFSSGPRTTLEGISRWARPAIVVVSLAGTYAIATALFTAGYLFDGRTTFGSTVHVLPGAAAEGAGMRDGDRVDSIAGRRMHDFEEIRAAVHAHPGAPTDFVVERDGAELHLTVTPGAPGTAGEGKIGIAPVSVHAAVGVGEALGLGVGDPVRVIVGVVKGLREVVAGHVESELSGPVGLARETGKSAQGGAGAALIFLGGLDAYFWPGMVVLTLLALPRRRVARVVKKRG